MLIGRTVLAEVGRNFLVSLTVTTGIAFFVFSVTFLKRTPGVGLGFLVEVFPLFFPLTLQFTVPLAVLSATVLTFGRMAGDGELTALHAAGVALPTVVRPVLAFGAVIAVGALLLTDVTVPFAAERLRAAKRDLPHQLQTSFRSGLCDLELGRAHISFESYDNGSFRDVCLETRGSKGQVRLFRAKSGSIVVTDDDRVVLSLRDARSAVPADEKNREMHGSVDDIVLEQSLAEITGDAGRRRNPKDLTARELAYLGASEPSVADGGRGPARAREELARRSALPAAAFFFALIGIPFGIWSARGGRVGAFLLAIAPVLMIYFPVVILGSSLARTGKLPAYPALWAGNAILLVVGVVMLVRGARR